MSIFTRLISGILALTIPAGICFAQQPAPFQNIDAVVGIGELLSLSQPAETVFVTDPEIVDIQVPFPDRIFVFGKKTGQTTLFAVDETGAPLFESKVTVRHNIAGIRETLAQRFPTASLDFQSAQGSLYLYGEVESPQQMTGVLETIQPYLGENDILINRTEINTPNKVRLKLRLLEASRDISEDFGVNWKVLFNPGDIVFSLLSGRNFSVTGDLPSRNSGQTAIGFGSTLGDFTINRVIDILEGEGMVSILAEPNLTALSGKKARFQAGGEFPYPVPASDNSGTTIQYKPFGILLSFEPLILDTKTISLKVQTEVSELSQTSVTLAGTSVPQTLSRQVETEIELKHGQSFAIGGLFQTSTRKSLGKTPWLADIPILGTLFRSKDYTENKTELIVLVTPYIVPNRGSKQDASALSSLRPESEIEYLFRDRLTRASNGAKPRLHGAAGFVY
ncbi:type II and III secretion system protein family protein [Aestuariispira insulae]|uniref:Pilus assembly protein CpaC n=1 Tax=Aestuariispira insulae TaxID=1461337 RepID=A0A3D9H3D2_9PROT|nr:type II and III secretion system protein family protein [Aestuariispira insulae]RED43691.1 pilus assembly protein CpaC [Aestuariispira insulae]